MARNTYRYILREGRKIVQFGITNGPLDRVNEHAADGKRFTSMTIVGPSVSRGTALDWERGRIETYQASHNGRRPRYNKI
jgi:predicted GIY-YIG superfamily endonuclease